MSACTGDDASLESELRGQDLAPAPASASRRAPGRTDTLWLRLNPHQVAAMRTGEKKKEYRKVSRYYLARLDNPYVEWVHFQQGYSSGSPWFRVPYKGYSREEDCITIHLGAIENKPR